MILGVNCDYILIGKVVVLGMKLICVVIFLIVVKEEDDVSLLFFVGLW